MIPESVYQTEMALLAAVIRHAIHDGHPESWIKLKDIPGGKSPDDAREDARAFVREAFGLFRWHDQLAMVESWWAAKKGDRRETLVA